VEITADMVDHAVAKSLSSESLTELKKLLSMFRTACIPHGESDEDGGREDSGAVSRYLIPSGDIYEKVMMSCIDNVYVAFNHLLGKEVSGCTAAQLDGLDKHPKWKKLQLLVVSYFKSIMHTLSGLAQSTKQSSVALFLIDSLENYIAFLAPLPRLAKNVVKVLLDLWAQQPDLPGEGEKGDLVAVRSHAFLRIRQIAKQLPGAIAEECFRSMYLKFARQCKTYNELTAPTVVFMVQSVAELYGTDTAMAYQQAFLYIRQLALHLRAALLKKTEETTRQITSMQFLNCVRLWTKVVCSYPSSENGLGALAFPLTQVIFGVISAVPSVYFTPLKFNLTTCLHQIASACELLVPTTVMVIETLEHADLVAKPTPSTDLAPKLEQMVRLPANSVMKAVVRDVIVQEAVQLLRQDTEVYRYHVGAPEYLYLTIRKLKAYLKKCKITKWRDMVRNVTGQMEQYSAAALQGRAALTCGPMSITSFEPLLPHGTAASRVRVGKLISGGKNGLLSDMAAASIAGKAAAAAPKDLFASSYSAIKAGQAKAARQAKLDKQKKRKGGDSDEEGSGAGSEDEDDYGDSEDGMSEGSDEDGEGMDYGSEGENSLEADGFGDDDSEEEAPAPKGKGGKAQGKAAAKDAAPAPRKNKNRKHKKTAILDYTGVNPDALDDDVGELDWDNEL
jgi:nucleolar complex protein 2